LVLAALGAQDLQAAAEEAQRRQTELLAVVAHELRDPLTPIRTAVALLGRVQEGEASLSEIRAIIERQVVHMSRLVDDLLDVSRVKTGKLRLERRTVDMAGIIIAAIDACQPAIAARRQRFEVQLPSGAFELYGDPVRLVQVVSNLLDNASKYTPDGGEIGLSMVVIADAVVMTVSDSGIGITPEALPRIFEPFVQESHAIGFNGAGLGIGLTVVRELVEAHGGQVVASSAGTGLGSEFIVILPLAPRQASWPESGASDAQSSSP
jgi:signal transduction histidine kinase